MADTSRLAELSIADEHRQEPGSGRWLGLVAVVVVVALLGGGWWVLANRPPEVAVAVAREVRVGGGGTVLNASGYVTARRKATVSSKVTGKVVEVLIEEGMAVAEGQIVARLDPVNARLAADLAAAELEAARRARREIRVRQDEAELDLARVEELVAEKVASQAELDRARAEVDSLAARLDSQEQQVVVAERSLALARQQLDDTEIRAPFAGVVVSKDAQPGEMISPVSAGGGFTRTGIGTVVDMASLEIEVDVNESYINRVEAGQPVAATLDAYPDWEIPARVIAIVPTADRQKATVRVRIAIEVEDPRILPDMGVKVAFQGSDDAGEATTGVAIPRAAVRNGGSSPVVLVVDGAVVERRAVRLGAAEENGEAVVVAGLAAGERVVVEGPAELALEIPEGEFLALMGPSGSGKSTLLNILGGLDRPTAGSVRVGEAEIHRLDEGRLAAWRARHVGLIFQFYNLMPVLNAARNVELPLLLTRLGRRERRRRVALALDVVGLSHRAGHYPRQLSGGEQQRTGIARALVTDPTLILADEPTGDLDRATGDEILDLLAALSRDRGKTVVMVTHDPHAARRADRVLYLDAGHLVEEMPE